MKGLVFRVGVAMLVASALASQGCLVPWKKYQDLKRKYEGASGDLEQRESELGDARTRLEGLRGQLKTTSQQLDAANQIVKLYEDKKKEAEAIARRTRTELDKLQKRLEEIARTHEGVEVVDGTLIIRDQLLFELGSAAVSEKGKKVLQDVAAKFKATDEIIQVDGHTDNIPVKKAETVKRFTDNWGLSAARASAVVRLLAKYGIPERRLYTRGFSMHRPRVPNTNAANRSKNRRVEVMFLPPTVAGPKAPRKEG